MTLLSDIPDMQGESLDAIMTWTDGRLAALEATVFTPDVNATFAPVELPGDFAHPCGAEGFPEWRRFFLATLLADWACYERPVDRVDFPRLKYIMSSSHRYFRLWCCRLPDGQVTPVGYSAWYPIAKFIHDGVLHNHEDIDDRGAFLPLRFVKPNDIRYGYVFNISIVRQLRNTPFSARMIRAFQRDGARFSHVSGMAVTVDEAGRKFSRIGQFSQLGDITVQGESEGLFVRKSG